MSQDLLSGLKRQEEEAGQLMGAVYANRRHNRVYTSTFTYDICRQDKDDISHNQRNVVND